MISIGLGSFTFLDGTREYQGRSQDSVIAYKYLLIIFQHQTYQAKSRDI